MGECLRPTLLRSGMDRALRVPELDALRGIGALAILAHHLWPTVFFFGWTRVDMFFVLSGYLITSIILRYGSRPRFLLVFWVRRALRILPAYYLLLTIICVRGIWVDAPPSTYGLIAHLSFAQNLPYYWASTAPLFPGEAGPTWSLAIEEQFYVVWPLILVLAGRSFLVPVAIWLMINSVAARILGLYPVVALARCDGLVLGSLLAAVVGDAEAARHPPAWLKSILCALGVAASAFIIGRLDQLKVPTAGTWGCGPLLILAVNIFYFSLIGLVVCYTGHPLLGPLRFRGLGYLGRISYGIFLYHLLIIRVVEGYLGADTATRDATAVLLSLLAAVISWECLERPIGNLKTLFRYEPSAVSRRV